MILTIPSRDLYRGLSAVASAASKDAYRAHLNAVRFRYQDSVIQLHGTNGHWLAMWEGSPKEAKGKPEAKEMLVTLRSVQRLLADIKVNKSDGKSVSVINFAKHRVRTHEGLRVELKLVKIAFPPVEEIIPKFATKASLDHIGLSSNILIDVARSFALSAGKPATYQLALMFRFSEVLGAMVVTRYGQPGYQVVAMPCRVDAPEYPVTVAKAG